MTERFVGKVVVIVGGNSGIGLASARQFAEEGARVILAGRNHDSLVSAQAQIGHGAAIQRTDVCNLHEITALFDRVRQDFGRIDVLFLNAGVLSISSIEDVTHAEWDRVQAINLRGPFFCAQAALSLMTAGAVIVLTGSTAAHRGVPRAVAYAASKAGLSSIGRSLAAALVGRGIRVNVVSPGPTETPIYDRPTGGMELDGAVLRKEQIEYIPMKRLGTAEEVAAAVLFLASDAAAFTTGIDFVVDGGALSV